MDENVFHRSLGSVASAGVVAVNAQQFGSWGLWVRHVEDTRGGAFLNLAQGVSILAVHSADASVSRLYVHDGDVGSVLVREVLVKCSFHLLHDPFDVIPTSHASFLNTSHDTQHPNVFKAASRSCGNFLSSVSLRVPKVR
jgi:hypothetical protein